MARRLRLARAGRPPVGARGRGARAARDLRALLGREDEWLRALERAHQGYLDADEALRAVRAAFWIGVRLARGGEIARATGWLARAQRLLEAVLWLVANRVLTVKTPLDRKVRPEVRAHGGPLIRVKAAHLARAGVEHVAARTVGVQGGLPVLDGGRVLEVANVIWCTGFRLDFSWIDLPIAGEDGYPLEDGGVVASAPGLSSSACRSSAPSPRC